MNQSQNKKFIRTTGQFIKNTKQIQQQDQSSQQVIIYVPQQSQHDQIQLKSQVSLIEKEIKRKKKKKDLGTGRYDSAPKLAPIELNNDSSPLKIVSNNKNQVKIIDDTKSVNQVIESSPKKYIENGEQQSSEKKMIDNENPELWKKIRNSVVHDDYKIGKVKLAEQYFLKNAYRKKQVEQFIQYELFESNQHYKLNDTGVYLYLELLKILFFYFLFAVIISALVLYNNYTATGLNGYSSSFDINLMYTSLGNNDWQTQNQVLLQTIVDSLNCILFLIFIFYWRYTTKDINSKNSESLNPEKYILIFSGLKKVEVQIQKIKKHFNKFFPLYEISIIYDYQRKFQNYIDLQQIEKKIYSQGIRIIQAGGDRAQLYQLQKQKKLQELQIYSKNYIRIPLYIVLHFQRISDRNKFKEIYKNAHLINNFEQKLVKCLFCPSDLQSAYKFQGENWILQDIRYGKPSNILWQNVDINIMNYTFRIIVSIIFLIILVIAFSSLIAICILYVAINTNCSNYPNITYDQVLLVTDQLTQFCYCQYQIYNNLSTSSIQNFCTSINNKVIYTNLLLMTSSILAVIINFFLQFIINHIVDFIRPKTKSDKNIKLFILNLLAKCFNVIIIPLLLNGNIFGIKPLMYFSYLRFLNFSNLNLYSDFNIGWYVYVAPYFIGFFIISIFVPPIELFIITIQDYIRRHSLTPLKPLLQYEMNQKITEYKFSIAIKTADLTVLLFSSLIFSSNLPILFLLAAFGIITNYLCYKKIIQKYSVKIQGDQKINNIVSKSLLIILFLHLCFTLWTLTNPLIFPSDLFSKISLKLKVFNNDLDRIFLISYEFVLMLLVLFLILIDFLFLKFITWVCCSKNKQIFIQTKEIYFEELVKSDKSVADKSNFSYMIENNQKYRSTAQTIQNILKYDIGDQIEYKAIANTSIIQTKHNE